MTGRRHWPGRADAVLLLALGVIVLSLALAARTPSDGSLEDRARALEAQLRCPTCQGLSIAESPAAAAAQMRALVREQLAAGASDAEIRAFFVARYGRWILLDPPLGGPDLLLWLAPALVIIGGALVVVRRAQAQGRGRVWPHWRAVPPPRSGPSMVLVGVAMVLALSLPIGGALGPRLFGREITGGSPSASMPSLEELEARVRLDPTDVGALVSLGDALLAADRLADAASRYRAALELDPNDVGALLGIGTILLAADRPDAAGPVFDRVLALAPDQPDARLYRAIARLRLDGRLGDAARADLERFLAVAAPNDPRRSMAAALLERPAPSAPIPPTPLSGPAWPAPGARQ